jgi:DNA (cytosine-5)-methyltransferase 1
MVVDLEILPAMRQNTRGISQELPGRGLRVASFFTGAGGLDWGFHEAGFDVVFANEIEPVFCDTLRANAGRWAVPKDLTIVCDDIRSVRPKQIRPSIDFVIGGPPCQAFSASGRRAGGAAGRLDPRGTLFEAYCRLLKHIRPVGFLFENVRGIFGTNRGKDWQEIVAAFRKLGYSISHRVIDACDYGIAQHRERLILVGHRSDTEFLFPEPVCGPDSPERFAHISPRQAFQGIIEDEDLGALKLQNGKYADLLPLVPPGGNYLFFTTKRGYPKPIFAYRSRFSDFLYKAHPDYPIKTLIASPGKYTGPFHWENRCFSVAEYKRLQGFPDDYKFCGTRSDVIRQIGNSVSPILARHLALSIAQQLFHRDVNVRLMAPATRFSFDRRKSMTAQRTRERHRVVALNRENGIHIFEVHNYEDRIEPSTKIDSNVKVRVRGKQVQMDVKGDSSGVLFAKVVIAINQHQPDLFTPPDELLDALLEVRLYGREPHCIQTMWNAIDDWVIRSSNFHSLYELYGHFTEPHPIFAITDFKLFSKHPIATFALHAAQFDNCSRYFSRTHLTQMFGKVFGTSNFPDLVRILRDYRFDIRCHETNIAIPRDVYMVAYPFTLPHRKQMNFSVHSRIRRSTPTVEAPA